MPCFYLRSFDQSSSLPPNLPFPFPIPIPFSFPFPFPLPLNLSSPPTKPKVTLKTKEQMGTKSPHKNHQHQQQQSSHFLTPKLISRAIYILIPLALLQFYLFPLPFNKQYSQPQQQIHPPSPPLISPWASSNQDIKKHDDERAPPCDYAVGRWAPSKRGPLYNGTSCRTIKDGQNCMAHGRPDTGYLHWRWRPEACRLTFFDAASFLKLLENKHVAFVGDSMARNQLESLLCLLSTASAPELVYRDGEDNKFRRWVFASHNATVSVFWSPFLVKGIEKSAASGLSHNKLYLDSADERWASQLSGFHVVLFSVGHWFLHPAIYHENGVVLGCHHCPGFNHTEVGFFDVFRKAVRTTLKEVAKEHVAGNGNKLVVVTTFSPAHFEGEWDKAGACPKKEPYEEGEKAMEYMDAEMRKIEVEEVAAAAAEVGGEGRLRIEALDVTRMALLRPDGHPGPYMYPNPFADGLKERVQNDCVHWCLPGPIDAWNEILLEMVKRWKNQNSRTF